MSLTKSTRRVAAGGTPLVESGPADRRSEAASSQADPETEMALRDRNAPTNRLGNQQQFPRGVSSFQIAMCLLRLIELVYSPNSQFELSCSDHSKYSA